MYALSIKEGGRILSATMDEYAPPEQIRVDSLPEGNLSDYRYQDGEYIYDPLPDDEIGKRLLRIADLKAMLGETDYIVIKIAEGVATWDDYPMMKEQRQEWREEINRLEAENAAAGYIYPEYTAPDDGEWAEIEAAEEEEYLSKEEADDREA